MKAIRKEYLTKKYQYSVSSLQRDIEAMEKNLLNCDIESIAKTLEKNIAASYRTLDNLRKEYKL